MTSNIKFNSSGRLSRGISLGMRKLAGTLRDIKKIKFNSTLNIYN